MLNQWREKAWRLSNSVALWDIPMRSLFTSPLLDNLLRFVLFCFAYPAETHRLRAEFFIYVF